MFKRAVAAVCVAVLAVATSSVCAQDATNAPTIYINTVCNVPLEKTRMPQNGIYNTKVIPAPGEKDTAIAFYLTSFQGQDQIFAVRLSGLNYSTVGEPVLASLTNITVNNKYEVATYKTRLVLVYSTPQGIRSVQSYTGGKTFEDHQAAQGYGESSAPQDLSLTVFEGPETPGSGTKTGYFAMTYWSDAARDQPFAEFMNISGMWNLFGQSTVEAQEFGMADATGEIRSSASDPPEGKPPAGNSPMSVASDGETIMAVYDVGYSGIEVQINGGNPFAPFSLTNSSLALKDARDSFVLKNNGVKGTFLLVSRLYYSGAIVADVTKDSGKTWSGTRYIRLGNAGGEPGDARRISVIWTGDGWIASWVDYAGDIGAGAGGDILFSTSRDGVFWTAPELAVDSQAAGIPIVQSLTATSPTSFLLAVSDATNTDLYACLNHDFVTGAAVSRGVAAWSVAALLVGAAAVLAN